MPTKVFHTPKCRLHKASGQAVVTISGKDVYLGKYNTVESRQRYDQVIAEWLSRGRRALEPEVVPLSVNELLVSYLGWAESYYRNRDDQPNEKELWHVRRALKPLRELFGRTAAESFGPRKLEVVQHRLVKHGYCRSTVNRYLRRNKHVFRWGVARELVPPTVYHALSALEGLKRGRTDAPETEPVGPVPDVLVDAILPFVSRQIKGLIELQRHSGCRPGEAVIMRGCDLDTTGALWTYKPEFHKTDYVGRERVIVLGPKAQRAVREFLKPDLQAYLFSPADADRERRAELSASRKIPISCGNRPGSNRKRRPRKSPGDHYTVNSYRRSVTVACDKAFPPPDGLNDDEKQQWRKDHRWHPNQLTRISHKYDVFALFLAAEPWVEVADGDLEAKRGGTTASQHQIGRLAKPKSIRRAYLSPHSIAAGRRIAQADVQNRQQRNGRELRRRRCS